MKILVSEAPVLCFYDQTRDIRYYISACDVCRTYETANQRETLMSHDIPDRPWAKIGEDLFSNNGNDYLVTVDFYSNFLEVDYLADTGAQTIIGKLKAHCARHGIPDTIVTDNGLQYSCHASPDSVNHGTSHTWQVARTTAKLTGKRSPQWRPANKSWESVLTLTVIHS